MTSRLVYLAVLEEQPPPGQVDHPQLATPAAPTLDTRQPVAAAGPSPTINPSRISHAVAA
jgi:hypothetical protein